MIKFPKIHNYGNRTVDKFLSQKEEPWFPKQWVVTEKIHGANLSVQWNGAGVCIASRNGILDDPSKFYNADRLFPSSLMRELEVRFQEFYGNRPAALFGEIFGKGIMKGVTYPDGRYFRAFALAGGDDNPFGNEDDDLVWSSWPRLREFCSELVKLVPVMSMGSLDYCLEFPVEFDTNFLDPNPPSHCPPEHRFAEGVVIRTKGDFIHDPHFWVFKRKHPRFDEKKGARKPKAAVEITGLPLEYVLAFCRKLTLMRMDSVISQNEAKGFNEWKNLFLIDAREDFRELDKAIYDLEVNFTPSERKLVEREINRAANLSCVKG